MNDTADIAVKFCRPNEVKNLCVIHYGYKEYWPAMMRKITNSWVKPEGGLWTSPRDSKYGWKDWCKSEHFRDCTEENSFKLKFKKGTRIIIIDSYSDLESIPHYSRNIATNFDRKHIDFELLSKIADAIWLTEKGQRATRHSDPLSLYGWDCESVLIMNPKCCYQIKTIL